MSKIQSETISNYRQAEYDIDTTYVRRWSPRSFAAQEVEESVLLSLFEAARWAPSANNEQPWQYIVARTEQEKTVFLSFINEGNRLWCDKAPILVLALSNRINSRGNPNRSHAFDTGTAWGFLALEAARKGLVSHAMGGFDANKALEMLGIPEDFDAHAVIAIGYQGEAEALPPNLQEREKPSNRRPIGQTLHMGSFGNRLL
ncbi:nitroreductase family protein [Paenibacillus mesophilus]|uniref:nitroreductase family protein n=1 Tax=Paenibacillus mesophilus TaxID=2582849 RepID=UPI00110F30ED|nr:nitroreductase family protein [Paenibacillus mesophilus]TMV50277.1 nitroreductase family protein [Paenibacillus mesophilus]